MALNDTPAETIQSLGPRKAMVDGDSVEAHSLKDVIAWDKYVKKNASGPSLLKLRRGKFAQPGPGSRFSAPEC